MGRISKSWLKAGAKKGPDPKSDIVVVTAERTEVEWAARREVVVTFTLSTSRNQYYKNLDLTKEEVNCSLPLLTSLADDDNRLAVVTDVLSKMNDGDLLSFLAALLHGRASNPVLGKLQ